MKNYILLLVSFLPVALIGTYIYKKDKIKEPKVFLFKLFFLGFLSPIFVLIITSLISELYPLFSYNPETLKGIDLIIYVFIGVSLVEEFAKYLVVYSISFNSKHNDSSFDLVVYSVFVSLGFAFFENLIYVYTGGLEIGLYRSISAVPIHACLGAIIGMYLSKSKANEVDGMTSKSKSNKIYALLIPFMIHGLYDYCIYASTNLSLLILIITVISTFSITISNIKKLSSNDRIIIHDDSL